MGPAPQLAALGTNPSCGTVEIVPASQGVRGNSSDLCPRALLGIPAEQGLWHFTGCNELLLLHWRQKHQPAVGYYHLLLVLHPPKDVTIHILANMGPSVAFPGSGGNTLPQALGQTGKIVNSWDSSYCVAFRNTSANLHLHSQQDKSKGMMTAKKYGPQTLSIHPLQGWRFHGDPAFSAILLPSQLGTIAMGHCRVLLGQLQAN